MNNEDVSASEKYTALLDILRSYGSVVIAFSGGVDSAFLLYAAHEALGVQAAAVTLSSEVFPARELNEAKEFCAGLGVSHKILRVDALAVPGFKENPPDRCYLCKTALFSKLTAYAAENGYTCVAEGSNLDDLGDYRPGLRAVEEIGIKSPLRQAGLYKADIRVLSRQFGLPAWNKPSYACLASRFVYGETITPDRLLMVERAEQLLLDLGFSQMRVRVHGTLARIEVPEQALPRLFAVRGEITGRFKELGFSYVTADLQGYRTGSMNEPLNL